MQYAVLPRPEQQSTYHAVPVVLVMGVGQAMAVHATDAARIICHVALAVPMLPPQLVEHHPEASVLRQVLVPGAHACGHLGSCPLLGLELDVTIGTVSDLVGIYIFTHIFRHAKCHTIIPPPLHVPCLPARPASSP